MKKLFILLAALSFALSSYAQQQVQQLRSNTPCVFPEFREAKVLQTFGRSIRAKVNIFLKNSALLFLDGDKVKQAYTDHIIGVEFDSVKYLKVDSVMGEVLASRKYNHLVRVTTIDMDKYMAETQGGDNLPFFEIGGTTTTGFFEIDGQVFAENGFPLKCKYYFLVKGDIVPANETKFKSHVRPEMRKAFKNLMGDRFWSWNDAESLKKLMEYLPD